MIYYAPIRCYEIVSDNEGRIVQHLEQSLAEYRNCPAYVLLGKPGSGKTTAFELEAQQSDCYMVTARDFITFDIQDAWYGKTLFIDGLDEVRARSGGEYDPFDLIRRKLDQLGRPKFRLSCREADWYSASDRHELAKVSPIQEVKEVYLDKLSEEDVEQILVRNFTDEVPDPTSFLEQAEQRDLIELIKNPQILNMLVTAVGDNGDWPETKSDTFKLACQKLLLTEQNRNHIDVNRKHGITIDKLMLASGMLCALLLVARKYGFSQSLPEADDDYPFVEDMDIDQTGLLSLVTDTELFSTQHGRIEYGHRIFAEYLSAYYLADKIHAKGLPIGRILALITGEDGIVVTELRGVYAWLATLCHQERMMLLEHDPLGLVLYGDVSLFNKEEQLKLLNELSKNAVESGTLGLEYWNSHSFAPFSNTYMEDEFQSIFESADRSETRQLLLVYVLTSMSQGKKLLGLAYSLVNVFHDTTWWPRNRRDALDILIRFDDKKILDQILTEINSNIIVDTDDDFLGTLLEAFYPERISPAEIFDYLHLPKDPNYFGRYEFFWTHYLVEQSSDKHIATLLDTLVERQEILSKTLNEFHYRTMIGMLLTKGLDAFGESIETKRLSDWLGLGLDEHGFVSLSNNEEFNYIRAWFKQRPDIQKELIEYQIVKCRDSKNFDWCMHTITERWFHADLPEDYGLWCLAKAKTSKNETEAHYLFMQSLRTLYTEQGNTGLSWDLLVEEATNDVRLNRYWDEARVVKLDPENRKYIRENKLRKEKQKREKQEYIKFIRDNLEEIKVGTARPGIFNDIGTVYYGLFIDVKGDTPKDRLNDFFEHDADLIRSALMGLRCFIEREDIPSVTEIFQSNINNKYFYYSRPYRAAIEELCKDDCEKILQLSDDKIDIALAFYFADGLGEETEWYKTLLEKRPEKVADIYIQYAGMALRAGKDHIIGIYQLAYDEAYSELAHYVAIPLLQAIPVRCTTKQLESLDFLLKGAIQHADNAQLKKIIDKKLCSKSMTVAQYVHWLGAGFVVFPVEYSGRLTDYVTQNKKRINYLSGFLSYRSDQWSPVSNLPIIALAQLIRLLGSYYEPYHIKEYDNMSHMKINASNLVAELINEISINTTDEATKVLEELQVLETLSKWEHTIGYALYRHRASKRESKFQHVSIEQVCHTLLNTEPANVADLSSLTVHNIQNLAYKIRHNPTSDYRQYWLRDKNKNILRRAHEEDCRNAFLSDLNYNLARLNISAHAEGQYADDNRADIKVSYGGADGYHIPIEVKCNNSRDLWYAIHDQLIAKYTRDPGAHGYGIYLVFWFGVEVTTPPPKGLRPKTAEELQNRLIDTLTTKEERQQISVCVVDVSKTS